MNSVINGKDRLVRISQGVSEPKICSCSALSGNASDKSRKAIDDIDARRRLNTGDGIAKG